MELDSEDIARFGNAIGRFEKVLDSVGGNRTVGSATITVNAGGIGVWVAVTCCVVCLAVAVVMTGVSVYNSYKIDRMQDYINNIYQQAPQLKPKEG